MRHKKEVKAFEGEKRAAIKTAKGKGKKAKSAVKDEEFKYEGLERDLKERHRGEVELLEKILNGGLVNDTSDTLENQGGAVGDATEDGTANIQQDTTKTQQETSAATSNSEDTEETKREKALAKKLKKKNQARQKEIDRQSRIKEENAKAGPSRRQMEMEALIALYLNPRKLGVEEVEADGNCLYRAVGRQCVRLGLNDLIGEGSDDYSKLRAICADVLIGKNRAEYEPFAEFGDGHDGHHSSGGDHPSTYEAYVDKVRSSNIWGGQLELRALSEGLHCPIVVFSAEGPPLTMGAEYYGSGGGGEEDGDWGEKKALLLSFHRHYYALGEHYNSVISQSQS